MEFPFGDYLSWKVLSDDLDVRGEEFLLNIGVHAIPELSYASAIKQVA
jgi:hypothetical protein